MLGALRLISILILFALLLVANKYASHGPLEKCIKDGNTRYRCIKEIRGK